MSIQGNGTALMKTIRFHRYGEPADVLALEDAAIPAPAPGRIRVRVHACGLNPADWALCRGLFPKDLPRGIGLDVAGVVDAVGADVTDVRIGDRMLGSADFAGYPSAGASEFAIMDHWAPLPEGLDFIEAAALPLAFETAHRSLDNLSVAAGHTVLINGAGTMVGFAAVQIAAMRGARVIATAGNTFADDLRAFGAAVTTYGDGMVERVRDIAGSTPDLILDVAPPNGVLPALVQLAGGDKRRVFTISDSVAANELGVRNSFGEPATLRWDILGDFAKLAAEGRFHIPVARTFPIGDWREALDISISGHARGKLVLLPGGAADAR